MVSARSLRCTVARGCESALGSLDADLPEYVPSVPPLPPPLPPLVVLWMSQQLLLLHKPFQSVHWLMGGWGRGWHGGEISVWSEQIFQIFDV